MPRPRKNDVVHCSHFVWRLFLRDGVWYADGRSNQANAGKHSLGTKDRAAAIKSLPLLDRRRAEELGMISRVEVVAEQARSSATVSITEGRKRFESYANRPRVTGGVAPSTAKRYRNSLDKFEVFASQRQVATWDEVTAQTLIDYSSDMTANDYAYKTQRNELTLLKQVVRLLIRSGHLVGKEPIQLQLRKAESIPAYCWRAEEVTAMYEHCAGRPELAWLRSVIIALACTGLRISELASLRWTDIDFDRGMILLTDETGHAQGVGTKRRLKSGRSRSLPIHPHLMEELRRISRREVTVFRGPRNGHLKPDTVRRVLVREVITPLAERFPSLDGQRGFKDGRLHSFRHYFCSTCAVSGVAERVVMDWLGHAESDMIRTYFHLHDETARRTMHALRFVGENGGRSADAKDVTLDMEEQSRTRASGDDSNVP